MNDGTTVYGYWTAGSSFNKRLSIARVHVVSDRKTASVYLPGNEVALFCACFVMSNNKFCFSLAACSTDIHMMLEWPRRIPP